MSVRSALVALSLCAMAVSQAMAAEPPKPQPQPQPQHTIDETIEWTWAQRPEAVDPALPNVLLVGDSITRNYYPEVVARLRGKANVYDFTTSASAGDPLLDPQIEAFAAWRGVNFDVVHFNNGMHGWAYSEADYGDALPALVDTLRRLYPNAALIWASTTPVRKPLDNGASIERVAERNRLARLVMRDRHIAIDDQFALMLDRTELHSDDIHFGEAGAKLQGDQVSDAISSTLGGRLPSVGGVKPGARR